MEVKIKSNNGMIDATIEMVDGVMVVSPKEEKVDISQFKDGDVLTYQCGDNLKFTIILKGEIDTLSQSFYFAEDYCSVDNDNNLGIGDYSDAITSIRYATEEEKKVLFDKLAEEGYAFDFDKRELVKLKWEPKKDQKYFTLLYNYATGLFATELRHWRGEAIEALRFAMGHIFRTESECQAFVDKLNQAISQVKP